MSTFQLAGDDRARLAQDGCLICTSTERLVLDHEHTIGFIRGVLCSRCNSGLGFFQDDPDRLRRAADYLEERRLAAVGDICPKCSTYDTIAPKALDPDGDTGCWATYRCPAGHVWDRWWHIDAWLTFHGIEVQRR